MVCWGVLTVIPPCHRYKLKSNMEQVRIIIGIIISSVLTLFTPIKDVMLAMLVLFSINGAGLLEDILHVRLKLWIILA